MWVQLDTAFFVFCATLMFSYRIVQLLSLLLFGDMSVGDTEMVGISIFKTVVSLLLTRVKSKRTLYKSLETTCAELISQLRFISSDVQKKASIVLIELFVTGGNLIHNPAASMPYRPIISASYNYVPRGIVRTIQNIQIMCSLTLLFHSAAAICLTCAPYIE